MRKVYVYHNGEMVEKHLVHKEPERVHDIMPDIPDFVSTVDKSVIHGRRGLREHNRKHGVTNTSDFTGVWEKFQKEREKLFTGNKEDPKRKEAIIRAFHKLEGRNW